MKKMMKKILCSLLVAVMCFTSAPLQGFVSLDWGWLDFGLSAKALATTGKCGDNAFWSYDDTTKTLTISGTGSMYDYGDAYSSSRSPFYHSKIKTLVIQNGITSIGNYTFLYCYDLTGSLSIPESVSRIGKYAFKSCQNLTGDLIIPDKITIIEEGCFEDCKGFSGKLLISKNVTNIEDYAFYGCSGLTGNLIIPENITTIGECAFAYCSGFSGDIVIPKNITTISYGTFKNCSSFSGKLIIPNNVTSIGHQAFSGCSGLTGNLVIPENITTIGDHAFSSCGFSTVYIHKNVTAIGFRAFANEKMTTITVSEENMHYSSDRSGVLFNKAQNKLIYCPDNINIANYNISDTVTKIETYAFNGCKNLKKITVDANNAYYSNDENGVLFDKNKTTLIRYPSGSEATSYTIPYGVTRLEAYAFNEANMLNNIIIPSTVTYIGYDVIDNCKNVTDIYYCGTQEQWENIDIYFANDYFFNATIHYNYKPITSYLMISSDQYSVDSIPCRKTAIYKINLVDKNSEYLSIDDITVQNNTTDIVAISTKKISDTELELTVEAIKDGDASISLFNGDDSAAQYFNFTVYSNTTTYRADQVPVTDEKLKTNFSRGDMTVDNFEYYFDENKGKYIATMDVYNSSGAIGVVTAHKQNGLITAIEQVDPYKPLPGDFGEFFVYLGTGAVSYLKGESFNYRYAGDSQMTPIEIEVPEDGYISVSCDVKANDAVAICNLVSIATDSVFKTVDMVKALAKLGDKEAIAKKSKETLIDKVMEYSTKKPEILEDIVKKLYKSIPEQFDVLYMKNLSLLSLDLVYELFENAGVDFCEVLLDTIKGIAVDELKELGLMHAAKKLIEDEVVEAAEESLLKAASLMFKGGEYVNLLNNILGAYVYNDGTGKTDIVFKPKGEDGFLCKETVKVKSDVINKDVILNTYVVNYLELQDLFIRDVIDSDFNRDDGLDEKEMNIDLNRIVEIREISLYENGKEIDKTFKATVEIDKPANMNIRTCCVYRVEKDGTYTKLNTRIEGNKIVFETDHFSHYIITGIRNDIEGTTPCDGHIYDEERTEPSCTEEGSITYTCYCGDTYTVTITANGHTDSEWIVDKDSTCSAEGSKHIECTVCEEVLKTEPIAKLPHNYNTVTMIPTCVEQGFTTYTCACGDSYVADYVDTAEHKDTDGDECCDYCDEFLGSQGDENKCSHICHKSGFMGFIWKIINFFQKLFSISPICECGVTHY